MARPCKTNLKATVIQSKKYPWLHKVKVSGWVRGVRVKTNSPEYHFALFAPVDDPAQDQLNVYRVGAPSEAPPVGYVSEKLVRSVALNALCERYATFIGLFLD